MKNAIKYFKVIYKNRALKLPQKSELYRLIANTQSRNKHSFFKIAHCPDYIQCSSEDDRPMLQFFVSANLGGTMKTVIAWAHPDILFSAKGTHGPWFIGGTFGCV